MKRLWKKIVTGAAMCALTLTCMVQPIQAAVENGAVYSIETNGVARWPQMGNLFSETAVLMDAETGAVLVNKGMYMERYPASITKVMTTLIALENSNPQDQVTFTEAGLARIWEGTNINSQLGETLTMEQCLNIVMMVSANEVAAQVAIQVAGSEEAFVEMMNSRAAQLGCKSTHFNNASGLPDENHYTTAYDMALIFQEAMKNEQFMKILEARTYTLPATNKNPEPRAFNTHLALVSPSTPEYYADCIGGKTGVTQVAQNTLVTAAKRDDRTLIAVTMRAADAGQACADTKALYEYGFNNFKRLALPGGSAMIPNDVTDSDLITRAEERDGEMLTHYYLNDKYVGTTSASAVTPEPTMEPQEDEFTPVGESVSSEELSSNPLLDHKGLAVMAGILGGLIVLGIILIILKLCMRER